MHAGMTHVNVDRYTVHLTSRNKTKQQSILLKNAFDTGIYGLISSVIINPNAVPVVCDLLGLVIYDDVFVMGEAAGIYTLCFTPGPSSQHDKNCAYRNGISNFTTYQGLV